MKRNNRKSTVLFVAIIVSVFLMSSIFSTIASPLANREIAISSLSPSETTGGSEQFPLPTGETINVNAIEKQEPAPMGVTDYGIGPNGHPYVYTTSSFLGTIDISSLETYNSSQSPDPYWMSFQLNVNLWIEDNGVLYDYWIQDVAQINTTTNYVDFLSNIWNYSSTLGHIYNSSVQGNGIVTGNDTWYYDFASSNLPGNEIYLPASPTIELEVNASEGLNDTPVVDFLYNDGYGWVTYDTAFFIFANHLNHQPVFLVDGYTYNPWGDFYDAELVACGVGSGYQTYDVNSGVELTLEYYNGNNYQEISNAYNFGSDTAEGISNVIAGGYYYNHDGQLFSYVTNGTGSLGPIWDSAEVSSVKIITNIAHGAVIIGGSNVTYFTGGTVNVTLWYGSYDITVLNLETGNTITLGNVSLSQGINYVFNLMPASVKFVETGLPAGTLWFVNLTNGQSYSSSNSTILFTEPNGTYSYTISSTDKEYRPSPYSGSFTAAINGTYTMTITFSLVTYSLTFIETGLPAGTDWSVTIGSKIETSLTSTVSFYLPNGSYSYTVGTVNGYSSNPHLGTVVVNGTSVNTEIQFSNVKYAVTFTESGLPGGSVWYVNVSGQLSLSSTGTTISISLVNSSYTYSVSSGNKIWKPSEYSGSFVVNGASVSEPVTFTEVTYSINFTESGLPAGKEWYVNLTNSSSVSAQGGIIPTLTFPEPNGTYSFTVATLDKEYAPSIYTGSLTINGASKTVTIIFSQVTYPITFTEVGLPAGTSWTVVLNGSNQSSTLSSITFEEPNGSYSYKISPVREFLVKPSNGLIQVAGAGTTQSVTYSKEYSVAFKETGLPSGTTWWVTLNGTTKSSVNNTIIFIIPNGTYSFNGTSEPGFTSNLSGSIVVSGNSFNESIVFAEIKYSLTLTQTGIPSGTPWSATLTGTTFTGQEVNVTLSSTNNSLIFNEPNGTYSYAVHLPSGYTGTNLSGSITASGHLVTANITVKSPSNYTLIIIVALIVIVAVLTTIVVMMRIRPKK